jgi:prophage maintenance system killer protein
MSQKAREIVEQHALCKKRRDFRTQVWDVFLRINGYTITASSTTIYKYIMKLLEEHAFDMEHLVPWLQQIVQTD